jgi:dTDP-4-dehydrorhamnose 3,5-epimerase
MKVVRTPIDGALLIEPEVFSDERGFFMETWNAGPFEEAGVKGPFVQDNHSHSVLGVLRGLHFQTPRAQGKLVRVIRGAVFDVIVDIRPGSPTFGGWFGRELTADNRLMMWAPPGLAHGFLALSEEADVSYKCTDFRVASDERIIRWDDPNLAIRWPLEKIGAPILSVRDAAAPSFKQALAAP